MRSGINTLLLVALFAVASLLAWQHQQRLFEDKGRLRVAVSGQTAILSWNNRIELPMARRVAEAFEKTKDRVRRFVIELNSPGGSLREGGKVIEVIGRMKRTHAVDTFVAASGICLSMCVPIYLQGRIRAAAPTSRWMFHEPVHKEFLTGKRIDKPEFERDYFSRRFFERYFTRSEMNPVWRKRLETEWKGREVWKSGEQLFEERSNIVTRLAGDA